MKHIKRVITIFLIFIVMAASLVPSLRCSHFVYADSDNWTNCTTLYDQGQAFKAYCASRNLTIDGSILDGVTKFTTSTYQNLLNKVGLDMNAIQADIKKSVDSNGNVKYLLTAAGASAMNTIFSQFLQDNDLDVGDNVNDKNVYDGKMFTDDDGNSSLVWIMPTQYQNSDNNSPIQRGSTYLYDGYDIKNMYDNGIRYYSPVPWTDNFDRAINYTGARDGITEAYVNGVNPGTSGWGAYISYVVDGDGDVIVGQNIIYYVQGSDTLYVGNYVDLQGLTSSVFTHNQRWNYYRRSLKSTEGTIINNVTVNITTNNNTINNNTYEDNDTTIINPGGTTEPGGGGGDNPGGDTPSDPDDWGVDLPDLNIDWLLTGKENKFPFNIPFNILLTLSLLNAEPEAPHFEGTVDLGVYQWNYEVDLEQFDPVAEVCRNFEFIAFLIGLMLLTKRLIWG